MQNRIGVLSGTPDFSNSALNKHVVLLLASAFLWSLGGVLIKSIDWTPVAIAGARSLIAMLIIGLVMPGVVRKISWQSVPGAIAYSATVILFVVATKLTTAANAIFLQYTAPIYIAIISPLVFAREHEMAGLADHPARPYRRRSFLPRSAQSTRSFRRNRCARQRHCVRVANGSYAAPASRIARGSSPLGQRSHAPVCAALDVSGRQDPAEWSLVAPAGQRTTGYSISALFFGDPPRPGS